MADRRLLMIPGPIELEPDVLTALSEKTRSHVDPTFIEVFGRALGRLREVFLAPDAQPFVVAGSGTLAMDMAAANLVEPGTRALVVDTGWFSARMAEILARWGAEVVRVGAPIGGAPSLDEVAATLARGKFDLVTITHVDTSTGVRADVEGLARLAKAHGALVVVDGVCAAAAEVLRMQAWDVDVALTASQKAIGAPPGLAIVMARPAALARHRARKAKVPSLYLDFAEWLPIMEAYEARRPHYFATPAVNLVAALDTSLGLLIAEGMEARFARHARLAGAFRAAWSAMELSLLPRPELAANTLSAVRYPSGADAKLVAAIGKEGIVVAGGLHPEAKAEYFRVGHMGAISPSDVVAVVSAIERAFRAAFGQERRGLAAAQAAL